jgi:dienelactone hydrolase
MACKYVVAVWACFAVISGLAQGTSEPGSVVSATYRHDLAYRLQQPMIDGLDVSVALTDWFTAEKVTGPAAEAQKENLYLHAMASLKELRPLPVETWPANPTGVTLTWLEPFAVPDLSAYFGSEGKPPSGVNARIVEYEVDKLKLYGVVLWPSAPGEYPPILYMHGAAFGVPSYSLAWLAQIAKRGYTIVAPALRGEDLFSAGEYLPGVKQYTCQGQIENLGGEVNDALGMMDGAFKLKMVKPGKFAILGHSYGAGVGLLVAARSPQVACVVSYDAWLVNPFRYYWDRLRDGPNNWFSWEAYTHQSAADQLAGLMKRSIVHHADHLKAPVLLFIGGAYNGSVFHQSHADLVARLKQLDRTCRYVIVPGGGHNFVLSANDPPARTAFPIQDKWLETYFPPQPPAAAP